MKKLVRTLLFAGLVLCACGDRKPLELSCDLEHSAAEIEGHWHLSADGKRKGCKDRGYEGELEISSEGDIQVKPTAIPLEISDNPPDAFIERITERQRYDVQGSSLPAHLTFHGSSNGSCIDFTMTEELSNGDQLDYDFKGQISSEGFIEGNFTGDGPKGCDVSGRFTIDVD